MSHAYTNEPPTHGKVLLATNYGDLEIELWPKEAPRAVRNFVQLCLEGYYDGTRFHRIVPGAFVQGGDPTGTGTGGESIYGRPFALECHPRLRFERRGRVAMAHHGDPDANTSQFFMTLDKQPELDQTHTLFGKVVGDTLYNLAAIGQLERAPGSEAPLYPVVVRAATVLANPFPEIVPRTTAAQRRELAAAAQAAQAAHDRGVLRAGAAKRHNPHLLSFGGDGDGGDDGGGDGDQDDGGDPSPAAVANKKSRTHAVATSASTTASASAAAPRSRGKADAPPSDPPAPPGAATARRLVDTHASAHGVTPGRLDAVRSPAPPGADPDAVQAQIRALEARLLGRSAPSAPSAPSASASASQPARASKTAAGGDADADESLSPIDRYRQALEAEGRVRTATARRAPHVHQTVEARLAAFRERLASASAVASGAPQPSGRDSTRTSSGGGDDPAPSVCRLHHVAACGSCGRAGGGPPDANDPAWLSHRFIAGRRGDRDGDRDAYDPSVDDYVVVDPRRASTATATARPLERGPA